MGWGKISQSRPYYAFVLVSLSSLLAGCEMEHSFTQKPVAAQQQDDEGGTGGSTSGSTGGFTPTLPTTSTMPTTTTLPSTTTTTRPPLTTSTTTPSMTTTTVRPTTTTSSTTTSVPSTTTTTQPVVCGPFENQPGAGRTNGLSGELFTLNRTSAGGPVPYDGVADYVDLTLNKSKKVGVELALPNLIVTPRLFSTGFATQGGDVLKTESGENLIEFFGISATSSLKLTANDAEGEYQFAVLSDDGSKFYLNHANTGMSLVIDNDDDHHPELACSSRSFSLDRNTVMPIKMEYYQGPRQHIALVLLWRKVPNANSAIDSRCGVRVASNLYWWDTRTSPPTARQTWIDLLADGWVPIPTENFVFPDNRTNPCSTAPM